MITRDEVKMNVLKVKCRMYSKLGGFFIGKAVNCTMERNFGYGERYMALAELYYDKMHKTIDELTEIAR